MLDLVLLRQQPKTTHNFLRRAQWEWIFWYLGMLGAAALAAALMVRGEPGFSWVAWLLLIINIAAILYRPLNGIYLTLFWTLAADQSLMAWYPFIKNFSSRETLLYLHDAVIFSPLELLLVVTLLSWFMHDGMRRKLRVYQGPLFWPAMGFAAFIAFGLVYGIGRGGSANVALWETRAIFYMFLMIVLVSNLLEKRDHIKNVLWVAVAALLIKSLYAVYHLLFVLRGDLSNVASLTDHQAAIHLNVLVVLAAAAWLYRIGWRKVLLLWVILPPVFLTIIAAQRRAGFVALLIALALLAVIMFVERRRAFWLIVPPAAVLALAYMGIFWNSSHPLGGPAQAVKSVVAEDQADYHDRLSNDYRKIENYNSTFTIKQEPLTGVGFGNKFYIVIPMPDISNFVWWEYMPHNSVIYIWIKAGVGAFLALLLFVGLSIAQGMRATVRLSDPHLKAISLTATIFIIMHFVYAYVDISWEAQGMILLGIMLGILNSVEPIAAVDHSVPARRWPWQPEPVEPTPLLPLPAERMFSNQ